MEFENNPFTETIIPTADQGVFNPGDKVVLQYKKFVWDTSDSSEWIEKKAEGTIMKIEKSIFYPENYGQSIVTIKWDGQEKETVQFACALFKKQ